MESSQSEDAEQDGDVHDQRQTSRLLGPLPRGTRPGDLRSPGLRDRVSECALEGRAVGANNSRRFSIRVHRLRRFTQILKLICVNRRNMWIDLLAKDGLTPPPAPKSPLNLHP